MPGMGRIQRNGEHPTAYEFIDDLMAVGPPGERIT